MATPRKPVTFTGSSPLAPLMAQYVQEKRACGYRFNPAASSLRRLDAHLCRQGLQQVELPKAATSSWLAKQPHETGKTQRARVNLVRQFASVHAPTRTFPPTCQITPWAPRIRGRSWHAC
jgi:hypothetical protein